MNRRHFLKTAGAGTLVGMAGVGWGQEEHLPSIARYRTLGRTDIKMSDISLGSYGGLPPRLVLQAYDMGVNYFDTAPDYRGNGIASEESIGKVFHKPGRREKVAIGTKMCAPRNYPAHWPAHTPAEKIAEGVEGSLKRLRTDHIDVLLMHAIGETDERIEDPEMLNAFRRLKKAGKARFLGVGIHGPRKLVETVEQVVDSGHYDMIQVAYNFFGVRFNSRHKELDHALKKAHEKGVGVVAMKTKSGAKKEDVARITANGEQFSHACLKWALSNPNVSGALVTVSNARQLKEYVAASGKKLGKADVQVLDHYAAAFGKGRCRIGCGECLDGCPHGVAIPTLLRYRMYDEAYGMRDAARQAYAALPPNRRPLSCAGCSAPCVSSCPHQVDIPRELLTTQARLECVVV